MFRTNQRRGPLARVVAVTLLAMLVVMIPAAPAAAAAGGGCATQHDISSCVSISYSLGRVSGDFYRNSNYRSSCTATLRMEINGTFHSKYTVSLTHYGRFPEAHHPISPSPWRTQTALTHVDLYSCFGGRYQYTAISPPLYF